MLPFLLQANIFFAEFLFLEKELPVCYHDQTRKQDQHYRNNAFGELFRMKNSHGDVRRQMKQKTRDDAPLILVIQPVDNERHRENADKEIRGVNPIG